MNVAFLDLRAGIDELREEIDAAWRRVCDGGRFILGAEVAAFETEFAEFCGARACVGVGNGLDALRLLLWALGIGRGDEVIVPAYTAVATWMAVTAAGARPIGVDVEETTFNIDPQRAADAISARTKAIVAVHLFGRPADVETLADVAAANDLVLLEDAAQAHGAFLGDRRAGSLGRAAAFSFYPTKNLGALGDGGAVTTDDEDLAEHVRMLRIYGWRERSVSETFGVNSRLDELQAAILRVKLRRLDEHNTRRRTVAAQYANALGTASDVVVPPDDPGAVWHVYPVRVHDRRRTQQRLSQEGISTLVHYDPLPHLTPAYRSAGWRTGAFPIAERLAAAELSLPMYPQLPVESVGAVAAALRRSTR